MHQLELNLGFESELTLVTDVTEQLLWGETALEIVLEMLDVT